MAQATGMADAYQWEGHTLKDRDGERIGKIDALYLDIQTDKLDWALVDTGVFGSKPVFVPLAGAEPRGEHVVAQVDAAQVRSAPKIHPEQELSETQEVELFRHYGVDYTIEGTVTATGNGQARAAGSRSVGHATSGSTGNVLRATDKPATSEEQHEVVLRQQEVVTEKRAVLTERVHLDRETVVAEQTAYEEVRKEQIEAGTVGRRS